MSVHKISADFNETKGKIKPMHATNGGPRAGGRTLSFDFTDIYQYMGIPYVRLHDIEYPYGMNQFVDIHCIFPDFDADETDPDSYNFKPTDDYLNGIINAGGEVFFRLGESIDHYPKPLYIHPPKSPEKWAKICEHIIMHYNEGWADGFNMGIKYWEIWNEPDNSKMWTGTKEQFFELYATCANHLKNRFGDSIKVGGYASSGFYMLNRSNASEWFNTLVPYMHEFFGYITSKKTKAPIDFFSWHCYADSPEEVALHQRYASELLEQYGIKNCESILDEFNMFYSFSEYAPFHKGIFTDVAASMILGQKSGIDMIMHYMFNPNSVYNCAFCVNGMRRKEIVPLAGSEALYAFNCLYRLGSEIKTDGDIEGKLYVLGAKNDNDGALMIVSRDYDGELEIDIDGKYSSYDIKQTDDKAENRIPTCLFKSDLCLINGKIKLSVNKEEIVLITMKK